MQEVAAPARADALDLLGQHVGGAGGQEHLPGLDGPAGGERQRESGRRVDDAVLDELDAVAADLGSTGLEELGRGCPVAGEEALHGRGRRVAGCAGVDDDHAAASAAEHERRRQARGAAADDRHVVRSGFSVHALQRGRQRRGGKGSLPFLGNGGSVAAWLTRA